MWKYMKGIDILYFQMENQWNGVKKRRNGLITRGESLSSRSFTLVEGAMLTA